MHTRSFIKLLIVIGLLVAACGTLFVVQWQRTNSTPFGAAPLQNPPELRVQLYAYISAALDMHARYTGGKISYDELKKEALQLTVPAVLKERHLTLIVALEAGRKAEIEDMMHEYRVLQEAAQ